jgi:uncharacterized protein
MQISNRTALIMGASSAIGLAFAKLFAKDGYNLVIVARSQDELERIAEELETLSPQAIQVIPIAKDLFNPEAAIELYEEVKASGLTIDVLVNNAGQGKYGAFVDTDISFDIDDVQLNITSLVVLTKLFLKEMIQRNEGKILQLGPLSFKHAAPYHAVCEGTKAFIRYFTAAIINELKNTGVTLTLLQAGGSDKDFFQQPDFENAKVVIAEGMVDPAQIALDGYRVLMAEKEVVTPEFQNNAQSIINTISPDQPIVEKMRKQKESANTN